MAPETPLANVVRLMARTGLHQLPIVGAEKQLVGIVSQSDPTVALPAKASSDRREGK